jgi:WD40 repeat protein
VGGRFSPIQFTATGEILAHWSDQSGGGFGLWNATGKRIRDVAPDSKDPFLLSADGRFLATIESPLRRPGHSLSRLQPSRMVPYVPTQEEFSSLGNPGSADEWQWQRQEPTAPTWEEPGYFKPSTVHVWDVATGRALTSLTYNEAVREDLICFSPDGSGLLRIDRLNRLHIRDVRSGKERLSLKIGQGPVALSPDGRKLAVVENGASNMGTVGIWDLEQQKKLHHLEAAGRSGLTFSPDSKIFAIGGLDSRIRLWDVASGKELFKAADYKHGVNGLAFSADSSCLVSIGSIVRQLGPSQSYRQVITSNMIVWKLATQEQLSQVEVRYVWGLTPDAQLLVAPEGTQKLALRDPFGQRPTRAIPDVARSTGRPMLYNNGTVLAYSERGEQPRWNPATQTHLQEHTLHLWDASAARWAGPLRLQLRSRDPIGWDCINSVVALPGNT